jgi:uncharacterized protein YjiS (DUF1127 family)
MNSAFTVSERRRNPPTVVLLQGLRPILLGFARWVAAARDRNRTHRILGRLDDAMLKDIGLVRTQIEGVEHDPRYTRRSSGV